MNLAVVVLAEDEAVSDVNAPVSEGLVAFERVTDDGPLSMTVLAS